MVCMHQKIVIPSGNPRLSWIIGSSQFFCSTFICLRQIACRKTAPRDVLGSLRSHGALAKIRWISFMLGAVARFAVAATRFALA